MSKDPLRILLVTEPSGGGSGHHVAQLANGYALRGHKVTLVYSQTRAESGFVEYVKSIPSISLHQVKMHRSPNIEDIISAVTLNNIILRCGPMDIIHAHSSKAGAISRMLPRRGAKIIYTPHCLYTIDPTTSRFSRLIYGAVEATLAKLNCDAVIAVGYKEAKHAAAIGIPATKVHTIVNGILPPEPLSRSQARRELGVDDRAVCIGFVGRLTPQKNPKLFLRAIAAARSSELVAVVIGSGELERELIDLIKELGLDGRIILAGHRPASRLMSAFDIFALTSQYEAMPYVFAEAVFNGLPIVTTDVGGVEEAVQEGVNGHIVPIDVSPHHLGKILNDLADDKRTRARFAANSLSRRPSFHQDYMIEETLALYRSL